jgi:hypothetical protein
VAVEYIKLIFSFVFAVTVVNQLCVHPLKGCVNNTCHIKNFIWINNAVTFLKIFHCKNGSTHI